jgi:hypothetical protein
LTSLSLLKRNLLIPCQSVEIVSQVPAEAKAVGYNGHQLPLATQSLEAKDELEFEEDYRVDARAAGRGLAILDQIPHKRKIHRPFQAVVEVVLRDEFFEGELGQWGEVANLGAHHSCASPHEAGTREAHATDACVSTPVPTPVRRVFFNGLTSLERPVGLSSVRIEAMCRAFPIPSGPLALKGLFLGHNGV